MGSAFPSLAALQTALRQGELSSAELVETCLRRIASRDATLRAFLWVDAAGARRAAREADARLEEARRTGETASLPPLLGIPLAVKDVLAVKGMPATAGSRILEGFVPPYTATAVERLQTAGAIVLGKTNTDEFAMGSSTENSAWGVTRNPWNPERVPGGSSGGSAAAVAGGLVPAALGTDTGGSVRQPASYCGLTGLKPTYGRVSRYGLIAYGSSLDTVGVLSRSAEDAALLLSLMAGRDRQDATSASLPVPAPRLEGDVRGLRIGLPREYFIAGIQPEVRAAVSAALEVFASLGADVVPVSLPHTEYALPVYYLIAPAEASANLARFDGVRYGVREPADTMWEVFTRTRGVRFGAEVKRRIMLGTYALSAGYYEAYYGQAQKVRTLIRGDFEAAFTQVDLLAAPVAPTTAFRIGEHTADPLAMYLEDIFTITANLAGIPALAFPVGFDGQNLPIGMQLMGPHFGEAALLRAAHAYQRATDWHLRLPPLEDAGREAGDG
ncbi:MAG TPA: Asp-tRNA(Asn)/Glu-tRNA(Gln) amidotransferase subunit GatA [Chloroflexi bacterium]|nr:Asp-tRNA(Asn)/Glu-tRNA(Gln) amidotransferase subunit GatA [Chloroflexota bacterium]